MAEAEAGLWLGGLGFKDSTTETWLCDLGQATQPLWTCFLICEKRTMGCVYCRGLLPALQRNMSAVHGTCLCIVGSSKNPSNQQ